MRKTWKKKLEVGPNRLLIGREDFVTVFKRETAGSSRNMKITGPEDVLAFWLDEIGPQGWYSGGEALDQEIMERF
jgi:hypothetical protein